MDGLRLGLGLGRPRRRCTAPPLTSLGVPRSGNGHVDHVEVLGHHGLGEDRTRLAGHLGAEVAVGEVRQREQPHLGVARDLRRLERGRVRGLLRALALLVAGRSPRGRARSAPRAASSTVADGAVSPLRTTLRPGRGGPSTSSGVITRPSASVTDSPRLEQRRAPARRDAERVGGLDVEAARPRDARSSAKPSACTPCATGNVTSVVVAALEHVARVAARRARARTVSFPKIRRSALKRSSSPGGP